MTMLAQYLYTQNIEVLGSDTLENFATTQDTLERLNLKIIEEFDKDNIPADADLIVYSSAYNKENNVEVASALKGKIKAYNYAQAFGQIFNQKYGIAVTGSHGKTTTSAWLGYVMEKAGKQPSVMTGTYVPQFDGASIVGKSDYLVAELDEYQNKLQYFEPKVVLLNNIDYDHPDFFSTEKEYLNVFIEFIKKIPTNGYLVANIDDPIVRKIIHVNCRGKVITYGINEVADFIAYGIKYFNNKQYFKVKISSEEAQDLEAEETVLGDFSISLSGKHNIYNALAVIATCIELNIELVIIRKFLEEFTGTARRMQVLGEYDGAIIIDDYAHHPTEIKTTLEGARQIYNDKKLIVVFHPHTFTRTKALLDEFSKSFKDADEVIVLDIYGSAREEHGGVHSKDLVQKIKNENNKYVLHISTLEECENYLRNNIKRDDVVILMGAGDVFKIGENLIK